MRAVWRLNLLVTLVFLTALMVTLFVMLLQASHDIEREVEASLNSTLQLLTPANQATVDALLTSPPRHVSLMVSDSPEPDAESFSLPALLKLFSVAESGAFTPVTRDLPENRYVHIVPDPEDEWEEVQESAVFVLILFVMTALLSCLAISLAVRRGLSPVEEIISVIKDVGQGHFEARLGHYPTPEINSIAEKINSMAHKLQVANEKNTHLTQALLSLKEQERSRLARELHDDLGQYLTGIRSQAYVLAQNSQGSAGMAARDLIGHCDDMQKGFRRLINELHPVALEEAGLPEAVLQLVDTWSESRGVPVKLVVDADCENLSFEKQVHIYRIVQESLNNVSRHARATLVELSFRNDQAGGLCLRIRDNGCGNSEPHKTGVGISSMKERARIIGGKLQVETDNTGFGLVLNLPAGVNNT